MVIEELTVSRSKLYWELPRGGLDLNFQYGHAYRSLTPNQTCSAAFEI
jgi:hypothetical protein